MARIGTEFGERLRAERERRGITLETMSARTKVNLRHLDALERGDYKVLPGGVFRRGFVRAYLGSVGLDERTWLERFDSSYADYARTVGVKLEPDEDGWVTFAANVKKNRGLPERGHLKQWLGVVAMFGLLLIVSWLVWHFLLQARVQKTAESHVASQRHSGYDSVAWRRRDAFQIGHGSSGYSTVGDLGGGRIR